MYVVGPLYKGHFGTLLLVLITEVSSIQRSLNTLQYYTGTQNDVLIIEVSALQRFVTYCIAGNIGSYYYKYINIYYKYWQG